MEVEAAATVADDGAEVAHARLVRLGDNRRFQGRFRFDTVFC